MHTIIPLEGRSPETFPLDPLLTPPARACRFPHILSNQGSGVVVQVGTDVKTLKPGDAVYGLAFAHGTFPLLAPGFAAEYAVVSARLLLRKPDHLSFEEAACVAASAVTCYQCVRRYFELTDQSLDATLEGKTVFIPGALSATGNVYIQMAKNCYGAGKVISTVSTPKVKLLKEEEGEYHDRVGKFLDQVVDYKTQDVVRKVGKGTVDFVLNTQWQFTSTFPLLNRRTGAAVSIASVPSAATVQKMFGRENVPFWVVWVLNLVYLWYDYWKLRGTNIRQDFVSGNPGNREDLEKVGEWIAQEKIRPIVTIVEMEDLDEVRRLCGMVASGKGGVGQLVVRIKRDGRD